jgi:hypothetical protein
VDKKIAPKLSINSEEDKASDTEQTNINSSNLLDEEEFLEAQKMKEMIQKKSGTRLIKAKFVIILLRLNRLWCYL